MSSIVEPKHITEIPSLEPKFKEKLLGMMPVILPILAALVLIYSRAKFGPNGFLNEGALTMLALICYITASVVLVTNLLVKEQVLNRLGLLSIGLGYCFNLSGWMIRWIEAGDAEGWKDGINGFWRYYPLDTLYALTLGFCCGAALTTLVIVRKPKYSFLGSLSMPIISVILTIAVLFGNEIHTLMPILDSYWRPIHVSVATIAYGVCLVSFGVAFAYLLKDGVRSEAIAIAVILYGFLIYFTIGGYGSLAVPFHAEYGPNIYFMKSFLPVRAVLSGVGPLMALTLLVMTLALAAFIYEWVKPDAKLKKMGWNLFRISVVLQALAVVVMFVQIRNVNDLASKIPQRQYPAFGEWLTTEMTKENNGAMPPELAKMPQAEVARLWINDKAATLTVSLKSNPVEVGALISLFVCLFLVALFAWKRKDVEALMPSLEALDSLLYKTVGVAFPLLCLLLITGAVWANESWGRYWGWDPKETGALIATMAYAGFLHTRIAHGWRGRRSAYFALLGFALVIFTWLGVSFILVGLHSYAQV
ncbi:MAG: cytochrome c biogenesis protein CcsA [Acidobacteria bacterium]|nr:cytochrome c biogenesis protein CcsA [Acidobacteriota bacterium]